MQKVHLSLVYLNGHFSPLNVGLSSELRMDSTSEVDLTVNEFWSFLASQEVA